MTMIISQEMTISVSHLPWFDSPVQHHHHSMRGTRGRWAANQRSVCHRECPLCCRPRELAGSPSKSGEDRSERKSRIQASRNPQSTQAGSESAQISVKYSHLTPCYLLRSRIEWIDIKISQLLNPAV